MNVMSLFLDSPPTREEIGLGKKEKEKSEQLVGSCPFLTQAKLTRSACRPPPAVGGTILQRHRGVESRGPGKRRWRRDT
jgi:hypothetical protein